MNVNFRSMDDNDLPSEHEFNNIPALELVADADNADALRRQLILPPALPVAPTRDIPDPEPPPDTDAPLPDPFIPEAADPHNKIGSTYDELHVTIFVLYVVPVEYITYLVVSASDFIVRIGSFRDERVR